MSFAFEKLIVYQRAVDFSDQVCATTNIAEGNGRFTIRDRKNFFGIARGSVQECVPLLELANRRSLIQPDDHLKLKGDLKEIAKMLSGLINSLDKRQS